MKGTPDPVWYASAIEGLATIPVLDAWSSMQTVCAVSAFKLIFLGDI